MENGTKKRKTAWCQRDQDIGKRLRQCRKTYKNADGTTGLTQEKLAEMVNCLQEEGRNNRKCSEKQIGYIENGTRSLSRDYAFLFAKTLGVRAEYLLLESDFKTNAEQFQDAISTINFESDLLFTGLSAFALLTDYKIFPPTITGRQSINDILSSMREGYQIVHEGKTVSLSLGEMNQFENEVCDFVELKLKHLFKQKGVE